MAVAVAVAGQHNHCTESVAEYLYRLVRVRSLSDPGTCLAGCGSGRCSCPDGDIAGCCNRLVGGFAGCCSCLVGGFADRGYCLSSGDFARSCP